MFCIKSAIAEEDKKLVEMKLLYNGFVPSRTNVNLEKYEHLPLDNYRMYSERKIPILLSKSTGEQIKTKLSLVDK